MTSDRTGYMDKCEKCACKNYCRAMTGILETVHALDKLQHQEVT